MRSDNGALSTVKDALGLGAATIDVAYTGMNSAIESAKEIKNKLVAARQPGVDRGKIQSEITELQRQLAACGSTSVFSGENWISVDSHHRTTMRLRRSWRPSPAAVEPSPSARSRSASRPREAL
jgi:flagellin